MSCLGWSVTVRPPPHAHGCQTAASPAGEISTYPAEVAAAASPIHRGDSAESSVGDLDLAEVAAAASPIRRGDSAESWVRGSRAGGGGRGSFSDRPRRFRGIVGWGISSWRRWPGQLQRSAAAIPRNRRSGGSRAGGGGGRVFTDALRRFRGIVGRGDLELAEMAAAASAIRCGDSAESSVGRHVRDGCFIRVGSASSLAVAS